MTDPFAALTFVTGPAILANACATLQNGASTRYHLAITQWREFRAAIAAGDEDRLALLFVDPPRALALAERRIHLQLRGLALLNAGVGLFGAITVCGLVGAALVEARIVPSSTMRLFMLAAGGVALAFMLAAIGAFFLESACGRTLVRLHPRPFAAELLPTAPRPQPKCTPS